MRPDEGLPLRKIALPSLPVEGWCPRISTDEYEERLHRVVERMRSSGLDVLAIYADREHFANMSYCIGFDPRFEEALLLLDAGGNRALLVGNECLGCLPDPALQIETILFQDFSLPGQPRGESRPLRQILADFGIAGGVNVGCTGWKYLTGMSSGDPALALEIPAYLVDALRELSGDWTHVRNACDIFMNPVDGLRVINSADQIAQFEYAQAISSSAVHSAMSAIRDGVAEFEIERELIGNGLPLITHRTVRFGESMKRSLVSPTDNRARTGDMWSMAMGIPGSMICRAGAIARGPDDLDEETRAFFPHFVGNYYAVLAAWYRQLHVGVVAGQVYDAVIARHDPALMCFALNPGHYIHLDEWVHSPFVAGSEIALPSGCVLQADIIPRSQGPRCAARAEEGVALADAALRAELARRHPACWERMQARRSFMADSLGIVLDESVLPLSNTPGWLPPYLYAMEYAFCDVQ